MNLSDTTARQAVTADDLRAALQEAFACQAGMRQRLELLERRPHPYCSTYSLEELDLSFEDHTTLTLIFKDLSWQTVGAAAREAKPAFLYDPLREIHTYRDILAASGLSTAAYYGATVDLNQCRYWLFLEKIEGISLIEVGEFEIWQQVARWLAGMHARFSTSAERGEQTRSAHLLRYDGDYYRLWLGRALAFLPSTLSAGSSEVRGRFGQLAKRYDRVIERLVALPRTIIHGEFYASNVLVAVPTDGDHQPVRVCPVDWEMAALGPGLVDLAALTAGRWSDDQKAALAAAYYAALPMDSGLSMTWESFLEALDFCRLHLAFQWLGWSQRWSPPPEHVHNWLGEALQLADKLSL